MSFLLIIPFEIGIVNSPMCSIVVALLSTKIEPEDIKKSSASLISEVNAPIKSI